MGIVPDWTSAIGKVRMQRDGERIVQNNATNVGITGRENNIFLTAVVPSIKSSWFGNTAQCIDMVKIAPPRYRIPEDTNFFLATSSFKV